MSTDKICYRCFTQKANEYFGSARSQAEGKFYPICKKCAFIDSIKKVVLDSEYKDYLTCHSDLDEFEDDDQNVLDMNKILDVLKPYVKPEPRPMRTPLNQYNQSKRIERRGQRAGSGLHGFFGSLNKRCDHGNVGPCFYCKPDTNPIISNTVKNLSKPNLETLTNMIKNLPKKDEPTTEPVNPQSDQTLVNPS